MRAGWLTVAATAISLVVTFWHLGRPAMWLDEAATDLATRRSWPNLFRLFGGTDAPLVPYYTLEKILVTPERHLGLLTRPELLLRWPSAVAAALAVGLLAGWLGRNASPAVGLAATGLALASGGVSRYAQEARPYGFTLLLAILATLAWWRMMRTRRAGPVVVYVVILAVMVALQALAAGLVLAHIVAAWLHRPADGERPRRGVTFVAVVVGLLLVSPLTLNAVHHGSGGGRFPSYTIGHVLRALSALVGTAPSGAGGQPVSYLPAVLVLVLALIGVAGGVRGVVGPDPDRTRNLTSLLACWAFVPVVAWALTISVKPNLLLERYVLFTLPAWVSLAGLGVVTVAALAARVVRLSAQDALGQAADRRRQSLVTGVLVVAFVGGAAALQWTTLSALRADDGHGENPLPSLAAATSAQYDGVPVYVSSMVASAVVAAYEPSLTPRFLNLKVNPHSVNIWPEFVPYKQLRRTMQATPEALSLDRLVGPPLPTGWTGCRSVTTGPSATLWQFHVIKQTSSGTGKSCV